MATQTGVWDLQEVRDKQLASEWNYQALDPGSVWAWGNNNQPSANSGSLGLNDTTQYSSPKQVGTDTDWMWVYTSAAIKSDGTLWVSGAQGGEAGANNQGNLGQNNLTGYSSPVQIPGTTWKSVCTGGGMRATKTDGTLWYWGYSSNGQNGLNIGSTSDTAKSSPTQIGTDNDWDRVFTGGGGHTGCFKTDGTLYMWGNNTRGQLGQNDTTKRSSPTQVPGTWTSTLCSSSYAVTHCARSDGTIWSWGDNEYGELGQDTSGSAGVSSPTQIASDVTTWKSITTGNAATLATKTDGTLWSWGTNSNGKGMLLPTDRRSSPTQVGSDSTWTYVNSGADWSMANKTDGTIWMAGINEFGQIGNDQSNMTNYSSPIQLPGTNWMVQNCFGGNGKSPKAKQSA